VVADVGERMADTRYQEGSLKKSTRSKAWFGSCGISHIGTPMANGQSEPRYSLAQFLTFQRRKGLEPKP
jgi:hypothetical protein